MDENTEEINCIVRDKIREILDEKPEIPYSELKKIVSDTIKEWEERERVNLNWVYYNPHPRGRIVDDCVKRAVCCVTGLSYFDTKKMLNTIKNEIGAPAFNCQSVCEELVRRNHWEYFPLSNPSLRSYREDITGKIFCQQHPTGKYILQMKSHWVGCIDGKLYDTWDSTRRRVLGFWVIDK